MTKTVITLLITFYSIARVVAITYQLYYGLNHLMLSILVITGICCLMCFAAAFAQYRGKLSGATLHNVLMLVAAAALANMLLVRLNPVNNLGNMDLLITGTIFDIIFYLGTLTMRFRDTAHLPGRSPFARMAVKTQEEPEKKPEKAKKVK